MPDRVDADLVRSTADAHRVDPLPDLPAPPAITWWALAGQWELGLLHRLVREGFNATVDVSYPANRGALEPELHVRSTRDVVLRVCGSIAGEADPVVRLPAGATAVVAAAPGEPAGFAVDGGVDGIEVSADGRRWQPPAGGTGTEEVPPHAMRNPVHLLALVEEDGVFAAPAEVLGHVVVRCEGVPRIFAGESREEAMAARDVEQRHELRQEADGSWRSVHELALRFVTVHDAVARQVEVEARALPVLRRGAFACSDGRLNDVWAASAFTLRQCDLGLLVDGIKRDRMPWMGDLALGGPATAYAFGDGEVVARGLAALGRNPTGYVNGIVDYSLWWLIGAADLLRYFDGGDFARDDADRIDAFVARLEAQATPDGVLHPVLEDGGFAKPVFIDWGVEIDPGRDSTALQLLWFWALRSAAEVLASVGHPGAATRLDLAARLRATLLDLAWEPGSGRWREYVDGGAPSDGAGTSVYAEVFAVASGIVDGPVPDTTRAALREGRARTPFVTAFAHAPLAASGDPDAAVAQIRDRWGAMLDLGATTFWEEFPEPGTSPYAMYGRPFGKSLCHAWAAGPARLLPEIVCGIRPVGPGWSRFVVEPALGSLDWAGALVPTPHGEIAVLVDADGARVDLPAGTAVVVDGEVAEGPGSVVLAPSVRTPDGRVARVRASA